MKKYYSLAVACITMFLCSCQKEDLNATIPNSTTSTNGSAKASILNIQLAPNESVNYGALIGAPSPTGSTDFQLNVADQLGITCLRERTLVPASRPDPMVKTKYKVVLNFSRASYKSGTPMGFVTNLVQYEKDLVSTIATYTVKPAVAVIENEESNKSYYSGTASQYINQLNTAITVMHANGVKVANGGVTCQGLNYLVYYDFISQGKTDSAVQFKQLVGIALKDPVTQGRGTFVDTLLANFAKMDLDYVNFHYKGTSPDTYALNCAINYLKKRTGKPVISNEIGQFDTDPNTLLAIMQTCTNQDMPYVLWYSPDENAGKKDTPVHHSNKSLTATGVAYKDYLQN